MDLDQKAKTIIRPQWSLITHFYVALGIIALTTLVSLFVLKKPVWIELKIAVAAIGLAMFIFYSCILY